MNKTEKLLIHGLPTMSTLDDFSNITHITKHRLYQCSKHSSQYYKEFSIKKRSGLPRKIAHPNKHLKAIQGWVLRNILDKLNTSPSSFGFEAGASILRNAKAHSGANAILVIDLKDFFHSVTSNAVFNIFKSVGYNNIISTVLTNICCFNGCLPQGGPCSPKLANLFCLNLDNRIQAYTSKRGITYTRYADDLTFSASKASKLHSISYTIEKIISDEKLTINRKKTKFSGPRQRKLVTGLVLYGDEVGIGTKAYKLLRAKIFNIVSSSTALPKEEIEYTNGYIAFLRSVDEVRYNRLKLYFNKLSARFRTSFYAASVYFPEEK